MNSQFFTGASKIHLDQGHFNSVEGVQTNNHYGDVTNVTGSHNKMTTNNYGSNNAYNYGGPQNLGLQANPVSAHGLPQSAPPDFGSDDDDDDSGSDDSSSASEWGSDHRMHAPQPQIPPNPRYRTQPIHESYHPHSQPQRQYSPHSQQPQPFPMQPNQYNQPRSFQQPPMPHSHSYPPHDSRYQDPPGGYHVGRNSTSELPSQSPPGEYPYRSSPPQTRGDQRGYPRDGASGPDYGPSRESSRSPWGNPPPPQTPPPSDPQHLNGSSGHPYEQDENGYRRASPYANGNPSPRGKSAQYDQSPRSAYDPSSSASSSFSPSDDELSDVDFLAYSNGIPSVSRMSLSDWSEKYERAQEGALEDRNPFRNRIGQRRGGHTSVN